MLSYIKNHKVLTASVATVAVLSVGGASYALMQNDKEQASVAPTVQQEEKSESITAPEQTQEVEITTSPSVTPSTSPSQAPSTVSDADLYGALMNAVNSQGFEQAGMFRKTNVITAVLQHTQGSATRYTEQQLNGFVTKCISYVQANQQRAYTETGGYQIVLQEMKNTPCWTL